MIKRLVTCLFCTFMLALPSVTQGDIVVDFDLDFNGQDLIVNSATFDRTVVNPAMGNVVFAPSSTLTGNNAATSLSYSPNTVTVDLDGDGVDDTFTFDIGVEVIQGGTASPGNINTNSNGLGVIGDGDNPVTNQQNQGVDLGDILAITVSNFSTSLPGTFDFSGFSGLGIRAPNAARGNLFNGSITDTVNTVTFLLDQTDDSLPAADIQEELFTAIAPTVGQDTISLSVTSIDDGAGGAQDANNILRLNRIAFGINFTPTAVPEPASATLLIGLALFGAVRRRR